LSTLVHRPSLFSHDPTATEYVHDGTYTHFLLDSRCNSGYTGTMDMLEAELIGGDDEDDDCDDG
jgi:hypothetical protein